MRPAVDMNDSTFGSFAITSATCCWCSAIALKEIPSAASVQHMSSP